MERGIHDPGEPVGPILKAGPVADAIIAAIQRLNSGTVLQDRGSYVRVSVPSRCTVTREAIEEDLGRPFRLPGDLEKVMCSFQGGFTVSEQKAEWKFHSSPSPSAS